MAAGFRVLHDLVILTCVFVLNHGAAGPQEHPVFTNPTSILHKGSEGRLSCHYPGKAYAVYWNKGDAYTTATNIILLDVQFTKGERSGPGYNSGRFNITDDFSLIINDVKISDNGKYFCEVSDRQTGTLYRNHTDVIVYNPPKEPFPQIKGCEARTSNATGKSVCNLHTTTPVNITCYVNEFFPSIKLTFEHDSQQVDFVPLDKTNTDGTKNKYISIVAVTGNETYTCVADKIPGLQGNRSAVVVIKLPAIELTSPAVWNLTSNTIAVQLDKPYVTLIVVPMVVVLLVVLLVIGMVFIHIYMRKNEREDAEGGFVLSRLLPAKSKISACIFEHVLWHDRGTHKIKQLFEHLDLDPSVLHDNSRIRDVINTAVDELTTWVQDTPGQKHKALFLSALKEIGHSAADARFLSGGDGYKGPITPSEIEKFSSRLAGRHCRKLANALNINDEKEIYNAINENNESLFNTQKMITDWIDNQSCSHYEKRCRLENAAMRVGRYDLLFQLLPDCQPTHSEDMFNYGFIFDDEFAKIIKYLSPKAKKALLDKCKITFVKQDDTSTLNDLRDWRDDNFKSHPKKWQRDELNDAIGDPLPCVTFLTDEELTLLNSCLASPQDRHTLLKKIRGSQSNSVDRMTEELILQVLFEWRDSSHTEIDKRIILRHPLETRDSSHSNEHLPQECPDSKDNANQDTGADSTDVARFVGCIAKPLNKMRLYKAVLVNLAHSMLLEDVYPFAVELQQHGSIPNVTSYTNTHDHTKGSLGLLLKLRGKTKNPLENRRDAFSSALVKAGFADIARMVSLDYEQSLSELRKLTWELSGKVVKSIGVALGLTTVEIETCITSGRLDKLEMMKLWKNGQHPPLYHYRVELFNALKNISEHDSLADDVLSEKLQPTEFNRHVLKGICEKMDERQRGELCTILKISEKEQETREIWPLVFKWIARWLQHLEAPQMTEIVWGGPNDSWDKFKIRQYLNNELFDHGLYELAHEIMILERNLNLSVLP